MLTKARSFTLKDNVIFPRQGFIGKELDSESDLADHGVRKYDYSTGRFMAIDPLWEEYKAFNTYQYAANNPMIMIDPSGFTVTFTNSEHQSAHDRIYNEQVDGVYVNQFYRDMYDKLNSSDVSYIVKATTVENIPGMTEPRSGTITTDGQNIYIDIDPNQNTKYEREGTHEMIHALQFERGQEDFQLINGKGVGQRNCVDAEAEAYEHSVVRNSDYIGLNTQEIRNKVRTQYRFNQNQEHFEDLRTDEVNQRTVLRTPTFFGILYPKP